MLGQGSLAVDSSGLGPHNRLFGLARRASDHPGCGGLCGLGRLGLRRLKGDAEMRERHRRGVYDTAATTSVRVAMATFPLIPVDHLYRATDDDGARCNVKFLS